MFSLSAGRYFLYREPTDIRRSFDGLCGLVTDRLGQNPMSGDVFIFINKPRNRMKILKWEPGGFVLFYKRLEKGTFELPDHLKPSPSISYNYTNSKKEHEDKGKVAPSYNYSIIINPGD